MKCLALAYTVGIKQYINTEDKIYQIVVLCCQSI